MNNLFNIKYERMLIHKLIFDEDRHRTVKYCYPALFYEGDKLPKSYNKEVFNLIKTLDSKIDLLTLHDRVLHTKSEPLIREFAEIIADTEAADPINRNTSYSIIRILKELLFRRLSVERAYGIIEMATEEPTELLRQNIYKEANKIITLDRHLLRNESRTSKDLAKMVAEKINSTDDVVVTGTPFINSRFGGLTRKCVSALLARPKHLKSTFGDSLISNTVEKTRNRGLIISLEDPIEERVKRIVASRLGLSLADMRFKRVTVPEEDINRILTITLGDRLFIVDVRDVLTAEDAFTCINDIKPDIALVDHLQKFQMDDMVLGIIKAIKTIEIAAIRTNSHICITSQVSDKKMYGRDEQSPQASDAQWTSALYQSASEMMSLFYKYQVTKDPFTKGLLEVNILASRYADAIGKLYLKIEPDQALIEDVVTA